jgi:Protein of unknown function (DUF3383)
MSTIPASAIVSVTPSVLSAGGSGLNGIGLMLDSGTRIPVGSVLSFNGAQAVKNYFGQASAEGSEAGIYFAGFTNATILPATLLMAQFNQTGVAAFLRGGNISSLTLAQLQAINGVLNITIDGYAHNAAALNLSAATSFSNAASIIATAINGSLSGSASGSASSIAPATFSVTASIAGNVMTVTSVTSGVIVNGAAISGTGVTASTVVSNQLSGTAGGIGTYAVSISQTVASTTVSGTYGTLTVGGTLTGSFAVGQTITGGTVTAGTIITQLGTGTGGAGTYFVNLTQTVASAALTGTGTVATVTFDSTSGGFVVTSGITGAASTIAFATGSAAAPLLLTSATGAVTSQGSAALTPATFMNSLIVTNSAWANFMSIFDPDGGSGNAQKQAFSAWKNTQNNRFGYMCWDPDSSPAASSNAASSLGQIFKANNDSGTMLIWEGGATTDTGLCAFNLGIAASTNFNQTNGRVDPAFKSQAGLTANVTDPTTAGNLQSNGYNFYGAYGSATSTFVWNYPGTVTGPYAWGDTFQIQIWLNTFFQAQFLTLFQNLLSVPFAQVGISLIQQTAQTVIQQGLLFGAFAPNTLTPGQIAQVNAQAGFNIATALQAQGYYFLAQLPSQGVQANRGPWLLQFFYIDRNGVHVINLSSVLIP